MDFYKIKNKWPSYLQGRAKSKSYSIRNSDSTIGKSGPSFVEAQ